MASLFGVIHKRRLGCIADCLSGNSLGSADSRIDVGNLQSSINVGDNFGIGVGMRHILVLAAVGTNPLQRARLTYIGKRELDKFRAILQLPISKFPKSGLSSTDINRCWSPRSVNTRGAWCELSFSVIAT